jgi:hypothetical protein
VRASLTIHIEHLGSYGLTKRIAHVPHMGISPFLTILSSVNLGNTRAQASGAGGSLRRSANLFALVGGFLELRVISNR